MTLATTEKGNLEEAATPLDAVSRARQALVQAPACVSQMAARKVTSCEAYLHSFQATPVQTLQYRPDFVGANSSKDKACQRTPNLPMRTHEQIVFLPKLRRKTREYSDIFTQRLSRSRSGPRTFREDCPRFLSAPFRPHPPTWLVCAVPPVPSDHPAFPSPTVGSNLSILNGSFFFGATE